MGLFGHLSIFYLSFHLFLLCQSSEGTTRPALSCYPWPRLFIPEPRKGAVTTVTSVSDPSPIVILSLQRSWKEGRKT